MVNHILISVLGIVIHIVFKLAKLEKMEYFSLAAWFKRNTFSTLGGILAAVGIVFYLQGQGILTYETALIGGYCADSIIKNASKSMINRTKK